MRTARLALALPALLLAACLSEEGGGLAPAPPAATRVKFDLFHKPLPEIPLPNDIATRYDPTSPTRRRINASMLAPTFFERHIRRLLDQLDGWSAAQAITIPFTGPLDVKAIRAAHDDVDYRLDDDVVYLVNVDRRSDEFGRFHRLDVGNGNFPVIVERLDKYWKNDPRGWVNNLLLEEADEDANRDGKLQPEEDSDADGVLDRPNYLPGRRPARSDLAGRADALMTFYERETNTLIVRPIVPLRERTTYAVVVMRRLKDAAGRPVGSPFPDINHPAQTEALRPLPELLGKRGVKLSDVAFAFTYTTQSLESTFKVVRDGLYGHGVQRHLATEFPPKVDRLLPLRDKSLVAKSRWKNAAILPSEEYVSVLEGAAAQFLGLKKGSERARLVLEDQRFIDYHVIGTYTSPQLFQRRGPDGKLLRYDDQSWPNDLERTPVKARKETVYFWLSVPRKEVSARGQGKPAPVVLIGHGYGGNRTTQILIAGILARFGLASISIDFVSHGLGLSKGQEALLKGLLASQGLGPFAEALFKDRAFDQNNDGQKDSGADFWSAYLFHTRDVVRQSALDEMQLVRILRSFDGKRSWSVGTTASRVAGDFDGDGVVDVGGSAPIHMSGGSLGGIMSMVVGALEPQIETIVPIVGGGGLSDIGMRSRQGGVPEALILRAMGPLYVGTQDAKKGVMVLETIVPDLNRTGTRKIAEVKGVRPGDTLVGRNLRNGELGCGLVSAKGTVRIGVPSDLGDRTRLAFYRGAKVVGPDCELAEGARPYLTLDTFKVEVAFQGKTYKAGSPLVALAEGLGLGRATPAFRRFSGIGQIVIEPGDPVVYAPLLLKRPMTYATGERTGAHILQVNSVGDMSVPTSSAIFFGRAAGLIEYLKPDRRYGKPVNQVLIDNYIVEGVNTLKRFKDSRGRGVHIDVDDYSGGKDIWTDIALPRLKPPLRIGFDGTDPLGRKSAVSLPMGNPEGSHGFPSPGVLTDRARSACRAKRCKKGQEKSAACKACATLQTYDVGKFMFYMTGRYMQTGGRELPTDLCLSRGDCAFLKKPPPARK